MSINTKNGILDITGAVVRVSKMEFKQATGFDTVFNNIARNTILLSDSATYSTASTYHNWALKLPNAWVLEADVYLASGTAGGGDHTFQLNFYNNVNTDVAQGYVLGLDGTSLTLKYDGTQISTATLSSTLNDDAWHKLFVLFERDTFAVAIDGKAEYTFTDSTLRDRVYNDDAGYVVFYHEAGVDRQIKNIKFVNGDKWIRESGSSNIAYIGGSVGIGTHAPKHTLDVLGNANVGTLTVTSVSGDGSGLSLIQSSNVSDFASNVTRIQTLETDLDSNVTRIQNLESANMTIDGEKTFSSNLEVGTANLFVDTTTGRVGIGVTDPGHNLDIVSEMNLISVSNTASIKYNSNVVTEYVRSKKLIKYPRVAMTQNDESSTTGYVASAFSEHSSPYYVWKLFNGDYGHQGGLGWQPAGPKTFNTSGDWTGGTGSAYACTLDTGETIYGAWVQIKLPEKIQLHAFGFAPLADDGTYDNIGIHRAPRAGYMLGSLDGTTWTRIMAWDNYTSAVWWDNRITIFELKNTGTGFTSDSDLIFDRVLPDYYNYFRMVWTETAGSTYGEYASGDALELYGIPEHDPDAHGTNVQMRCIPNAPTTDFLEVYYDMSNSSSYPGTGTTVTDLSGNSINATLYNGTGFYSDGDIKALAFDGTNDYLQATTTLSGELQHTVSMWVKLEKVTTDNHYICILGNPATNYGHFGVHTNTDRGITLTPTEAGIMYFTGFFPIPGEWFHLAYTFSGGYLNREGFNHRVRCYINGIQHTIWGNYPGGYSYLSLPSNSVLQINGKSGASGIYVPMKVGNFRLYNRPLQDHEIWDVYAYDKEKFKLSPNAVTFKNGCLGVGTTEPRPGVVLDVRGLALYSKPCFQLSKNGSGGLYNQTIVWNQVYIDSMGYNYQNGRVRIPVSGYYFFSCWLMNLAGTGHWTEFYLRKNYTQVGHPAYAYPVDSRYGNAALTIIEYCRKDDIIDIYSRGYVYTVSGGNNYNGFSGFLLSS